MMTVQSIRYRESLAVNPHYSSRQETSSLTVRKRVNQLTSNSNEVSSVLPKPVFVGTFTASEFIERASATLTANMSSHSGLPKDLNLTEKVFYSDREPGIPINAYLYRLVLHSKCSPSAFIVALTLIDRLLYNCPRLSLTTLNVHRILITSLMVATKVVDDVTAKARYFAILGGMPCPSEIVALELSLLTLLGYNLFVSPSEYAAKITHLACISVPKSQNRR